jgi:hypothetical protein
VSRLVDAGVWQLSLRHKTCRHNPKGFLGVGTAETRLDREVSSSEDSSSRGGTPDTEASEQRILSSHPGRSSPSAQASPIHQYRCYHQITLYTTQTRPHPGHSLPCQTRAPASHCTPIATPSTSNPPHRLSRSASCGTAPAVPPTACDLQPPALPFPRRSRPCTRIAYRCSLGHVSTNTDYANDAPRLGWAWTTDVHHSRRRLISALWTTRAALELKLLPT